MQRRPFLKGLTALFTGIATGSLFSITNLLGSVSSQDPTETIVYKLISEQYEVDPRLIKPQYDLFEFAIECLSLNGYENEYYQCIWDHQVMHLNLIILVEEELDIEIDDEVVEKTDTVGDLIKVCKRLVAV